MELILFLIGFALLVLYLCSRWLDRDRERLDSEIRAFNAMTQEKSKGFPYLAAAWVEYLSLRDNAVEIYLRTKPRPAHSTADKLKESLRERREYARGAKILEYKLKLYETLFPWLTDYTEDGIDEAFLVAREADTNREGNDPAEHWLPPGEYAKLSVSERNQRALDRFLNRQKSKWEIGRDYERFVGFLFEQDGYSVEYVGAIEGFDDLGRDLIACQGDDIKIIQCKYWSQQKLIHEKHVFQLFGTTIEYLLRNRRDAAAKLDIFNGTWGVGGVQPMIYTSTKLSARARDFAEALGIIVKEQQKIETYPTIKCNIGHRDGEAIYHLPFDQQYDRVRIEKKRGERFADTVAEAEQLGFRRALRWRGEGGPANA